MNSQNLIFGSSSLQKTIWLFVILILAIPVVADNTPKLLTSISPTQWQTSIPELMLKARIPGLSVAVILDGEIVWSDAFGVKNDSTKEPCDEATIFEAASLTKPFFAYIVIQYVSEGKLDLDKPLVEYISEKIIADSLLAHPFDQPGFRRDWFEKITARQILSHSSGMPHGEPADSCYPLLFEPGEKFKYSASGYRFLQLVLENIEGATLDEIARQRVLDPLGMTHTSLVWRDGYEQAAANGHDMFGTPQDHRRWPRASAAASMYTNATDYAKFICAILNNKQLSRDNIAAMLKPQIKVDDHLSWSLGFGRQQDSNGMAFWQWGDYGIYRNFVMAYDKQRSGIIWLTNSFYGLSILDEFVERCVGGKEYANAYIEYPAYDSPTMRFVFYAIDNGAGAALKRIDDFKGEGYDEVNERALNDIGYAFLNVNRVGEAIALFQYNIHEYPKSANVWDSYAEACMKAGELDSAFVYYKKSIELNPSSSNAKKRIEWISLELEARENPMKLTEQELSVFAGDYGPRHLRVQNDTLYYSRDGSTNPERYIYPLKDNWFGLQGNVDWRFHFVLDEAGKAVAIEGWVFMGMVDKHERNR